MKCCFTPKRFQGKTQELIDQANVIVDDYMGQGLCLTLRQLYYRLVAAALIPNTQKSYKRVGSVVNDARLAGLIDWDAIEDRTRNTIENGHWDSPARILDSVVDSYAIDKWADQPHRVEVWIEKEALAGVFEPVCAELDVTLFPCRGYTSQSEMYGAGQRLRAYADDGQDPVILHFGDHDPSGIDMTRDIGDRLELFSGHGDRIAMNIEELLGGCSVQVERIALNMEQVEQYDPPPNPAKTTDSRFNGYALEYGEDSWELDALDPSVLAALIREHVTNYRDDDLWEAAVAREEEGRAQLASVRDEFDAGSES